MKKRINITEPCTVIPNGRMDITQEHGCVSWKNHVDGHASLGFGLANSKSMLISMSEWYDNPNPESRNRIVSRDVMIEIDRDEAKAIIDHLQGWINRTAWQD